MLGVVRFLITVLRAMSMKGIIVRLTGGHHSNLGRDDADNAKIGQCSTYQTTRERKILSQNQYNSFTALTDGHKNAKQIYFLQTIAQRWF